MSQFTKEYFIDKFSAIPEDKWTTGELTEDHDPDCHCVLGHCGVTESEGDDYVHTKESSALCGILSKIDTDTRPTEVVYRINDGIGDEKRKLGKSPKERILKALSMVTAP